MVAGWMDLVDRMSAGGIRGTDQGVAGGEWLGLVSGGREREWVWPKPKNS